jgi:hypothetical protein
VHHDTLTRAEYDEARGSNGSAPPEPRLTDQVNDEPTRACAECGTALPPANGLRLYCGKACRNRASAARVAARGAVVPAAPRKPARTGVGGGRQPGATRGRVAAAGVGVPAAPVANGTAPPAGAAVSPAAHLAALVDLCDALGLAQARLTLHGGAVVTVTQANT